MKNSLRLTENELINVLSKMVKEARYSSVGNILRGGVRKKIKTIAILTGENPKGETASKEYNKNANQELKGLLKSARLGYRPIKGSYGTPENSFIINNISLDDAINIGEKFRQDTIVYGEVVGIDGDDINMNFKMVSEVGGRKFVIPFYGTIDRFKGENDKFFVKTKDYSDTKWKGGKAEPTSINIELDNELDELQERAIRTCCSTSYNLRGRIDKIIKENY